MRLISRPLVLVSGLSRTGWDDNAQAFGLFDVVLRSARSSSKFQRLNEEAEQHAGTTPAKRNGLLGAST